MTDVHREMLDLGFAAKPNSNIRYSVLSDEADYSFWVVHKQSVIDWRRS